MHVRLTYFWFLVILILAAGCSQTTVEPDNGGITGTVMPANAASLVYLVRGTDTIKTGVKPDGTYEISDIAKGEYKLTAKPNFGFIAPVPGPIIINGGFTTQAYPIRVPQIPASGAFSITIQDSIYTGTSITDSTAATDLTLVSGPYLFRFQLPAVSGPATFTTATNPDLKIEVRFNKQIWEAGGSQGNATLTVTSFDQATRRGNGTFSFTAVKAGEADIAGTNGSLQFIKFP